MREAKTFPKDAFCQTQTAHGHYDDQGSFWNVMGCMRGSDSEDHPGPHVAYYPYKIPNAQARFQIDWRGRSCVGDPTWAIRFWMHTVNLKTLKAKRAEPI